MWHISLNIPNIAQPTKMLNDHVDPIVLHMYTETQLITPSTSHVNAKYVLEKNM